MPPKSCARCQKIVYPTEELKCLDQTWHKLCFKCEECGNALNVKTFKAFDKKPYCAAHCPKLQATFVADTPEARRLAENSKIQSQVKYHEDFEKQKGTRTNVADDPELQRIRQNTAIQSSVAYKGVQKQRDEMESRRPTEREIDASAPLPQQQRMPTKVGSIADYDPVNGQWGSIGQGQPPQQQQQYQPQQVRGPAPYQSQQQPQMVSPGAGSRPQQASNQGAKYVAMYDYDAQEEDEASFMMDDVITNVRRIDEGWVVGTVARTGRTGMVPANYIQICQ